MLKKYWIIDPVTERIERYLLLGIESKVIVGFDIPVAALFSEAANLAALKALSH